MNIIKGRQEKPARTLLYGSAGVGKSTWAAGAPAPIFICVEQGADQLDVDKAYVYDFAETIAAIDAAAKLPAYKTIVLDTLDALENLLTEKIVKDAGAEHINDGPKLGYGKGYNALSMQWRPLLTTLDRARAAGKNIITIAHGVVKTIKDPTLGDYDRFSPKMQERLWSLVNEWSDDVLFATFDLGIQKTDGMSSKVKAIVTGDRVIHTTKGTGFEAKNRHGLPPRMPLDPRAYWSHIENLSRSIDAIKKSIATKIAALPATVKHGDETLSRDQYVQRVSAAVEKATTAAQLLEIEKALKQT